MVSWGVHAVYPGTFDPFTPGHLDVVARARPLFDRLTVLVAVNAGKQPSSSEDIRAAAVRRRLPEEWSDIEVLAWRGLTADFCRLYRAGVIVRGVRNQTDVQQEYQLAVMNERLGVSTLFLPARRELVTMSSTTVRALGD